jgi:hypothetical protein
MSEMQNLKESADKQKAIQQHEAVHAYIDSMLKRVDGELNRGKKVVSQSGWACVVLLVATVIGFIASSPLVAFAQFVAIIGNIVCMFRAQKALGVVEATMREIDGCFNTLELLGLLDGGWKNRARRRKKESVLERVWAKAKTMKLWRPYGQPVTNVA